MLNLIRALTRGGMFLGEFKAHDRSRVALFDMEMDVKQHRRWLDSAGLLHESKLYTENLRGEARTMGLFDDAREEELVQSLIDNGIDVMIIDPIGPLLRAYGVDENSNSEVGRVIDQILAIKQAANVPGLIINHHQGKDGNLGARGASVLEDTPDAIWKLTKDERSGMTTVSAFGRDVDETRGLSYDPETHVLTTVSSRFAYINPDNTKVLLDALSDADEPISGNALFKIVKPLGYSSKLEKINDDLRELEDRGKVTNTGSDKRPLWRLP